jgi:hypothetical protein
MGPYTRPTSPDAHIVVAWLPKPIHRPASGNSSVAFDIPSKAPYSVTDQPVSHISSTQRTSLAVGTVLALRPSHLCVGQCLCLGTCKGQLLSCDASLIGPPSPPPLVRRAAEQKAALEAAAQRPQVIVAQMPTTTYVQQPPPQYYPQPPQPAPYGVPMMVQPAPQY